MELEYVKFTINKTVDNVDRKDAIYLSLLEIDSFKSGVIYYSNPMVGNNGILEVDESAKQILSLITKKYLALKEEEGIE